MPLFEYRCDKCHHEFALLIGVTAEGPKRECPECGGRKLTKLISRPARIVKGQDLDSDLGGPDYDSDLDDDLGDDLNDDDLDEE